MTELHLMIIVLTILCILFFIYWVKNINPFEKERRKRLERYWSRVCTGSEWRKTFPNASKDSIRFFLECFVDGFAFSSKKRLKFSPDDKIMDVYGARNPPKAISDDLELEWFSINLEKNYKINLAKVLTDDLTLGQLFEMTTKVDSNNRVVFYHDLKTEVMMGDHVFIRIFFRKRTGRVVYIPWKSKPNLNIDYNGLHRVGIQIANGPFVACNVLLETLSLKREVKLVRRDTENIMEIDPEYDPFDESDE